MSASAGSASVRAAGLACAEDEGWRPLCAHAEQAAPVDPPQQALDSTQRALPGFVGELPKPAALGDNCPLKRHQDCRHQGSFYVIIIFMLPGTKRETQKPIRLGREPALGHSHEAGFAAAPVGEYADGQWPKLGLLRKKNQDIDEAIDAEEINVRFVVRPHRHPVPSRPTLRELVRSISQAIHRWKSVNENLARLRSIC